MASSFSRKVGTYSQSLDHLQTADFEQARSSDFYGGGVIADFVRTFELAWKALQAALELQPNASYHRGSPRSVLRAAAEAQIVLDEELWLAMLERRNQAVHLYNQSVAEPLLAEIEQEYLDAFSELKRAFLPLLMAEESPGPTREAANRVRQTPMAAERRPADSLECEEGSLGR